MNNPQPHHDQMTMRTTKPHCRRLVNLQILNRRYVPQVKTPVAPGAPAVVWLPVVDFEPPAFVGLAPLGLPVHSAAVD